MKTPTPCALTGRRVALEPLTVAHAVRDTVVFSIIDSEWNAVKAGLEAGLTATRAQT